MIRFHVEAEIWGVPQAMEGESGLDCLISCEEAEEEEQLLGYKLSAGLWIFYATVPVLEEALKKGLIDPPGEELPRVRFRDMQAAIGVWLYEILPESFRNTTCEELAAALEQVNRTPDTVLIRVYDAWRQRREEKEQGEGGPYLMEELRLDLAARRVLSYQIPTEKECFEHCYFAIFRHAGSYEEYLDALAYRICREYRNSGDLFQAYRDNDFYDLDRFVQRLYRFEFVFGPEQERE